jgi:hypothetical protein
MRYEGIFDERGYEGGFASSFVAAHYNAYCVHQLNVALVFRVFTCRHLLPRHPILFELALEFMMGLLPDLPSSLDAAQGRIHDGTIEGAGLSFPRVCSSRGLGGSIHTHTSHAILLPIVYY